MSIKIKYNEITVRTFFSIFLLINVFFKGIGLANSSKLYLIALVFGLFLTVYKIIKEKYTPKEIYASLIIGMVGLLTVAATFKPTLFLTAITIIGMKGIDLDREMFRSAQIRLWTFIIVTGSALVGIIDNIQVDMWRNGAFESRYALGYGHPNSLHLSLFLALSNYIFYKKDKLKLPHFIIMSVVNFYVYRYSGSRTGTTVVFLLIILSLMTPVIKGNIKKLYLMVPMIAFVLCLIVSFWLSNVYNKYDVLRALNAVLNNRLAYANYYLTHYGISLFGIRNIMSDINAISDNSYTLLYIQYGIAGLITWIALMFIALKNIRKRENCYETSIAIAFIFYMLTEGFGVNIFMNYLLLFAGVEIFSKRKA